MGIFFSHGSIFVHFYFVHIKGALLIMNWESVYFYMAIIQLITYVSTQCPQKIPFWNPEILDIDMTFNGTKSGQFHAYKQYLMISYQESYIKIPIFLYFFKLPI